MLDNMGNSVGVEEKNKPENEHDQGVFDNEAKAFQEEVEKKSES